MSASTRHATSSARIEPVSLVVTCEHGGNRIPPAYAAWFRGARALLATHRGYDPGALAMARTLSSAFSAVLVASTISRLLVDLNRSPSHRAVYSAVIRNAPPDVRREIYRRYYLPYRTAVEDAVGAAVRRGYRVVHISSHSFAPILDRIVRRADVGLLYDPHRRSEQRLCARWQSAMRVRAPDWRVRRNYPYKGNSDGLTRYLRLKFGSGVYSGIELEINQRMIGNSARGWEQTRSTIVASLRAALDM